MSACANTQSDISDASDKNDQSETSVSDKTSSAAKNTTEASASYKYMQKLLTEDDIVLEIKSGGMSDKIMFQGDSYVKTWNDEPDYILVEKDTSYTITVSDDGKKTYTADKNDVISAESYKQQIIDSMFADNEFEKTDNGFDVFAPKVKIESEDATDASDIFDVSTNSTESKETASDGSVESNTTSQMTINPDEDIDGKTYLKIDGDVLIEQIRYISGKTMAEIQYKIRPIADEEKEYFSKE